MKRSAAHVVFLVLLFSNVVLGQGTGTIGGTVTDPSGAVVPSATITVTEVGTGYSRSATTSEEGYYIIPSLRPGSHILTVEAPGFRNYSQSGIVLLADQRLTQNVKLELGSATETVTVESAPLQVDTTTGTLKQVVDQARMVGLPLNGRNAADLTVLVAGTVRAAAVDADQGVTKTFPGAVTIASNGSRQNHVSFALDGGNFTDQYTNVNMPFPFPDALQEFSFQTSNYGAEHGHSAGGVVNVVTRSGTNELHGSAFGFLRNAVFNARNFFAPSRDKLKRSQFGGTLGGPVIKDRTFFFFGYQGTRIRNIQEGLSAFLPTPANLRGDFSALLSATHPENPLLRVIQIRDPATGQPFLDNQIPTSRFDPASLGLVSYLPAAAPGGPGQIRYSRPIIQDFDEEVLRIDHKLRSADRLAFRWTHNLFDNPAVFEPENILTYRTGSKIRSQNFLIHHEHIFRPNLLNDFRFTYARTAAGRAPAPDVPSVTDFGVRNIYQPANKAIQSIGVSGFFSFGDAVRAKFVRNDFSWSDDLRWVKGRHNISFGVYVERSRVDVDNQFRQPGVFSFTGDITGYAVADLLLGRLRTFVQGAGEFFNARNTFTGFYVQENFRASKRLALNLGLRYEPALSWREIRGRIQQFRLDAYTAGTKSAMFPNAPPGLFFPGDEEFPDNGARNDLNNFAPRVGFAYDVFGDGRTSIRGGTGVFFESRQPGLSNIEFSDTNPFSPQLNLTNPAGPFSDPLLGVPNPFPAPFPPPKDSVFPSPVYAITYDPYDKLVTPVVYNWNLSIEHQWTGAWLSRIAYVGSHASHLRKAVNLNPAVYIPGSTLGPDARRFLPGYTNIFMDSQAGNSSYHSAQFSLERRFAAGFTVLANYTFSRNLDTLQPGSHVADFSGDIASTIPWYFPDAGAMDTGPADPDRTHRFVASYVWQLPALSQADRWTRSLLGSWEISGIFSAQSGAPLTIVAGPDRSGTALGRDRAVITGSPYGPGACGTRAPCVDYLNAASFQLPPAGTFGNVGKGSLRGPDSVNWDIGFFKNIAVSERWRLQFRAEFFNAINRVNLGNPVASVNAGGFGSIQSAADPRIGQLALKIVF